MNLKAIIGAVLVLGLIVGGAVGWWAWGVWTASEERGVSLTLKVAPTSEQRKEMEEKFNMLLDDERFLQPIVKDLELIHFYGADTESAAVEALRDRSKVQFKSDTTIWIVHRAERRERELNDRLGRALGDHFVKEAFPPPPEE